LGCDAGPRFIEHAHRGLESRAFFAQEILHGHEAVLEDELARRRTADAAGTLAGIGDREDGDQVGDGAVGDPNFIAVKGVVIAAFLRATTHRNRGVGAAAA